MMDQLYCDGPGEYGDSCNRPVAGHGKGKCSTHLRQINRTGKMQPIAEELSPTERLLKSLYTWQDADGDQEYEAAFRTVLANCKNVGTREVREAVRVALADARARGVRLGRPPVVEPAAAAHLYEVTGHILVVASILGVSHMTVRRAVTVARHRNGVFVNTAERPRPPA